MARFFLPAGAFASRREQESTVVHESSNPKLTHYGSSQQLGGGDSRTIIAVIGTEIQEQQKYALSLQADGERLNDFMMPLHNAVKQMRLSKCGHVASPDGRFIEQRHSLAARVTQCAQPFACLRRPN